MERVLEMDIESFSDVDLIKCGVYAYADSPAFEILLFAFSFDGGETQIIDLAQGEKLPAEVEEAIFDVSVTKTAYNANFERTCLSKHFGRYIPPESWHCSAVQAAMLALPRSLEDVGRVLGLDEQKMKEGKELKGISASPVSQRKQTAAGRGTSPAMRRRSGSFSRPTARGMWTWRNPSAGNCIISPSRKARWNCTD